MDYLDENNRLINAIANDQNLGKLEDSARNLDRLQQNLDFLAAIADNQRLVDAQHNSNMYLQPQFYSANNTAVQQPLQLIQPQHTVPAAVMPQQGYQIMKIQQAQQMSPQILVFAPPAVPQDQMPFPQLYNPMLLYGQVAQAQPAQPLLLPYDPMCQTQICQTQTQQAALLCGQPMGNYGMVGAPSFANPGSNNEAENLMAAGFLSEAEGALNMPLYNPDSGEEGDCGV
ncbi:GRF-interacting factor 1-like [Zingiber officinale]|uniref:GRF-interacting factor 1-like n=1 Tax=Zingiber officinale TaxID=94328 RepID=UPI001C4B1AAB|nr:GRF-interacting factor 1-like [Zingiber officinale]XP_042377661.1 GRF-interacting factor 1-like [Zingiber officinale]